MDLCDGFQGLDRDIQIDLGLPLGREVLLDVFVLSSGAGRLNLSQLCFQFLDAGSCCVQDRWGFSTGCERCRPSNRDS